MNRFKSLKYALPVAVLLATTALSLTAARADYTEWWQSDDGSVSLWHDDATGKTVVLIEHDGKYGVYDQQAVIDAVFDKIDASNPDPNDPNNGKGTSKPDFADLIKHMHDVKWTVKVDPEDSPLAGEINGNGGGKVPHWNPGDDDGGNGPSNPPDNKPHGGLTAHQKAAIQNALNAAAREAALGGQNMFGGEGGNESWGGFKPHGKNSSSNNGKHQGDKGDGTVYGDDYKSNVPEGEDLGPKPELVNPSPELKGRGHAKKHIGSIKLNHSKSSGKDSGKTGKSGKSDGNTAVLSPGLLEGGNGGFSYNGPAGTGVGLGHGGGAVQGPTTRAHR
jgi:hypothetical protein